jgi:hypothetical protein
MKPEKRYWLDESRNVTRIFRALCVVCVLLVAADFLYDKHGHFLWEGWPGFHGLFGFLGCVFLVLAAKQLRRILMRKEDFYD